MSDKIQAAREIGMQPRQSRREFLAAMSLAGAAGLVGGARPSRAADAPPEVTTIRLGRVASTCVAPQYLAQTLLDTEGFSDVRYVATTPDFAETEAISRGEIDFALHFAPNILIPMEAGAAVTILAGVHVGCFELFGNDSIHGIVDLRGKTVAVPSFGSGPHIYVSAMASYVGLDPQKDIRWVTSVSPKPIELFLDGKVDAFLGFPPEPQELHVRNNLHGIVNSTVDHPWSQYFCCMLVGNAAFVRNHPAATKRVMRAIFKSADFCAANPTQAARQMVDTGFASNYDTMLQTLRELPYDRWRSYEPEDTVRFYALRLREAGMLKSTPKTLIAAGTDWRILNELRRELKS
jgi:NitT/TauT family transport system substrate-binding protein